MQRGFSLPVIMIVIVLFLLLPLLYWQIILTKTTHTKDVKGASAVSTGYSLKITSKVPSWDLYEYLCTSRSECTESLTSGHFSKKVSGGLGTDQKVTFSMTDNASFTFVKLLIKPSVGLTGTYTWSSSKFASDSSFTDKNVVLFERQLLPTDFSTIGNFSN